MQMSENGGGPGMAIFFVIFIMTVSTVLFIFCTGTIPCMLNRQQLAIDVNSVSLLALHFTRRSGSAMISKQTV